MGGMRWRFMEGTPARLPVENPARYPRSRAADHGSRVSLPRPGVARALPGAGALVLRRVRSRCVPPAHPDDGPDAAGGVLLRPVLPTTPRMAGRPSALWSLHQ